MSLQKSGRWLSVNSLSIPQLLQGSRYPSLDGLRGVAILMVLLAHFGLNKLLRPTGIYISGTTGVHIFFVLSGFLITTLLLKERCYKVSVSLRNFYIRRAIRILPLVYVFVAVLAILNAGYHLHLSAGDFISALLFYKNLPVGGSYYAAHFWSLAVEVQFYLVFPVLFSYSIRVYQFAVAFIVVAVPFFSILGYYVPGIIIINPVIGYVFKTAMYVFWKGPLMILVGSIASVILFKTASKGINVKLPPYAGLILLIAALALPSPGFVYYQKYISEYVASWCIAGAIVLSLRADDWLNQLLQSKLLSIAGVWSYSLYVSQQLFVGANCWQPWLVKLRGNPLQLTLLLKLAIVFTIAALSYTFIEKRFLQFRHKFEKQKAL